MTKANHEVKKYIYQNSSFKAIYSEHAQYGKFKITKFLAAIIREEFGHDSWKTNISYHSLYNLLDELREQFPQDMSPFMGFWDSPINYARLFNLMWDWWFRQHWNMIFSSRYHFITVWVHQRFTKPVMNFCEQLALKILQVYIYIFILNLNNILTSPKRSCIFSNFIKSIVNMKTKQVKLQKWKYLLRVSFKIMWRPNNPIHNELMTTWALMTIQVFPCYIYHYWFSRSYYLIQPPLCPD